MNLFISVFLSAAILGFAALFLLWLFYVVIISHFLGAPFVKTPREKMKIAFEFAKLRPGEVFMELGSGDGSALMQAAKVGARAIGVEINPVLVWLGRARLKKAGLDKNAQIVRKNFLNYPLNSAEVLYFYLLPPIIENLKEKFKKELGAEARVISFGFPVNGWKIFKEKDGVFLYRIKDI